MSASDPRGRVNLLIGLMLVGLGILFLLGQMLHVNLWQFLWPFFVIVPGLLFFVGMVLGGRPAGPLAIPGSIVTMTGLLLLYQSITGHWESWAYAWALIFPTSVGIGLMINGAWSGMERLVDAGSRWLVTGLVIFLAGGVIFELVLRISRSVVSDVVWPALLIALGIYLLMRRGSGRSEPPEAPPGEASPPAGERSGEFEPLNSPRRKK